MDAAEIALGQPMHGFAREGGAVSVGGHRRALAPLPARGLEGQERLDAMADLVGLARRVMLQSASFGEAALQPAELAVVVRPQALPQIGLAVEVALKERA